VGDAAQVTSNPASGTSRTVGQTIAVSNAAPGTRDAATISGVATTQGLAGTFTVTGISNGALAGGTTQTTAPIAFDDTGLLNGFVANGNFHFDVANNGPNGPGTGAGPYNFPLTATASGNTGNGHAPVAPGGSYAGLSGNSDKTTQGALVHIPTTATILAGTNGGGAVKDVTMTWRLRNANEQFPGGTTPPLPQGLYALTSDVLDLTNIGNDKIVIQMDYDPSLLTGTEADDYATNKLFLASFDGAKWVNTVLMNSNAGAIGLTLKQPAGAWTAGQTTLGMWGADFDSNKVWAVVDHNSLFASVPEPSTILIGLMGLVGLVGFARRRRG
jgi:hypothetical protein